MNSDPVKALIRHLTREYAKAVAAGKFPAAIRVQVDVGDQYDPLSWLASQKEFPKFFWRSDDGGRVLAYAGAAYIHTGSDRASTGEQWEDLRSWITQEPSLRCWIGGSFYPRIHGREWSDFDAFSMVVPKIGFERDPISAHWHLICQLVLLERQDGLIESTLADLATIFYREDHSAISFDILSRQELPSYENWEKIVAAILEYIDAGDISKVVLARCLHLEMSHYAAPEAVMARLLGQQGYAFMCQPAPQTAFLGVSPELLYHRRRDRLDTFAVAGTRPRSQDEWEDQRFKEALATSTKDKLEHKQVVDMLADRLKSLCVLSKAHGKGGMVELANQRHFYQCLRGRLLDGVNDEIIINALHPTPAVGGVPTRKAIDLLASVEPFDRGWYAGTIGWLNRDEAQMAVGIRSCLIRRTSWYIYGGAGVVRGSDALGEWEEIGLKMKNIMDVIDGR
ncbi:MAG: isochorismate synthase [Candidatus Omnitrophica bacterium]|nr:isochorismate synthase [Candidatus Omnitrophota bacterium]